MVRYIIYILECNPIRIQMQQLSNQTIDGIERLPDFIPNDYLVVTSDLVSDAEHLSFQRFFPFLLKLCRLVALG